MTGTDMQKHSSYQRQYPALRAAGILLREERLLSAALFFLVALGIAATFSDWIAAYPPNAQGDLLVSRYLTPSAAHPFGTDKFGRDVFSRVLFGGRVSLIIALSVVGLSVTFGMLYGTLAAYRGGLVDSMMMRVLDFLLAFPAIFLVITLAALFQLDYWALILVLSLTGWMETARLMRAEVLSIREQDFVLAARGMGYSHLRLIAGHIVPNCLTPLIVSIPLKVAEVILLESALSFLGLGVQPPTASWGSIINDGREALTHAWWISTIPGLFLAMTVMSFNLLGDGFRKLTAIMR